MGSGQVRDADPGAGPGAARAVGDMWFGDHLCLAYVNDEERRAVLTTFLDDGLRAGHDLVYLVDGELADAAAARLRDRLRDRFGAALSDGRLTVLPTAGTDLGAVLDEALARGRTGVRVTAQACPSLRGWPGTERFTAFEDAVHRAVGRAGRAMALCQFDRRWFAGDHLREIEARHGGRVRADAVYDDGVLTIVPLFAPPGLRLSGAIDESTLPALVEALRDVGGGAAHVCLDLSRLEFCDLDGLRALIRANEMSSVLDRQVILRSMPGCMELMMRAAGWDTAPGIVTESAP
ncbi:Anti-anti-sigma regulatory factor (antagonist of anti-sigma factor) [Actinomadura madurae]|uniref:Anti-anti-sigma regulatory factor (Antagonist of anti-sigma factor) n=1 Tax=Actinomadura madurae TaxID=1993 RepID=A0A1I5Q871_9ACTN|nr:MEDS domain-containing protein [Actinomadura madurae]SFP42548.1 Anti-anti-sigma regulatory factor (antagonist of anti-sigma factor) [Actinomadura madurae]